VDKALEIDSKEFITNNCEQQSYTDADHVVCVTRCAVDFLKKIMNKSDKNISVIPNGMDDFADIFLNTNYANGANFRKFHSNECSQIADYNKNMICENSRNSRSSKTFKLLYVGVLTESKGLGYILKAMRKVKQQGYTLSLTIAGKITPALSEKLKDENRDLSLHILGRVPFDELKKHYLESDAGIIASLQEQSSYVAIEMAMFGLPVITTAVDGLDEIFTDNLNALKVNTRFSNVTGLSVDVDMMAEKIIALIKDKELKAKLSKNVRTLYEGELTLQRMMEQTVSVYQKVTGEPTK
jgi:glycosyltransferase involved in cell wall biosynthesis